MILLKMYTFKITAISHTGQWVNAYPWAFLESIIYYKINAVNKMSDKFQLLVF